MKTGKNNRFLASILAASMMLTMSPFAFAADAAEQKEMTAQEQVQSATQNETNANPTVSQTDGQSTEVKTEGEGTGIAEAEEPVTPSETQSEIAESGTRLRSSGPRRIIRPADKVTQTYQFYCVAKARTHTTPRRFSRTIR